MKLVMMPSIEMLLTTYTENTWCHDPEDYSCHPCHENIRCQKENPLFSAVLYTAVKITDLSMAKTRPRQVGVQDRLINWRPFKLIFFKHLFTTSTVQRIYDLF
jgi:hypothetical protein